MIHIIHIIHILLSAVKAQIKQTMFFDISQRSEVEVQTHKPNERSNTRAHTNQPTKHAHANQPSNHAHAHQPSNHAHAHRHRHTDTHTNGCGWTALLLVAGSNQVLGSEEEGRVPTGPRTPHGVVCAAH